MLITATEIKFRSPWAYVRFLIQVSSVKRQLVVAPGLLQSAFGWNRTLTAWESSEHMRRFRNSGEHLEAMRVTNKIGWAKSVSWEAAAVPSWQEAERRLNAIPYKAQEAGHD